MAESCMGRLIKTDLPKFSLQKKRNSLWFIFYKISKEVIMSKIKRYVYIEVQTSLFIGQNKNLVEYRFTSYSKRKRKSFLFEYSQNQKFSKQSGKSFITKYNSDRVR